MPSVLSEYNSRQSMLKNTFEAYHYKDPYFKAPDFHSHDFYEFYFFIDGNVTFHIEENIYELVPGDVLIIPPGKLHRPVIVNAKTVYERIVFWINGESASDCYQGNPHFALELLGQFQSKNHLLHLGNDDFKSNTDLINSIIALQQSQEPEDLMLVQPYITILLINLYKYSKSTPPVTTETESTISRLILYINENIEKDLSLDSLSELFFMSKYHLIRTFKNYTNTTIGQYITSKRITRAKLFMQQGYNFLEASNKSGFNNYSNFYKAFSKETGVSPKKYMTSNIRNSHTLI